MARQPAPTATVPSPRRLRAGRAVLELLVQLPRRPSSPRLQRQPISWFLPAPGESVLVAPTFGNYAPVPTFTIYSQVTVTVPSGQTTGTNGPDFGLNLFGDMHGSTNLGSLVVDSANGHIYDTYGGTLGYDLTRAVGHWLGRMPRALRSNSRSTPLSPAVWYRWPIRSVASRTTTKA